MQCTGAQHRTEHFSGKSTYFITLYAIICISKKHSLPQSASLTAPSSEGAKGRGADRYFRLCFVDERCSPLRCRGISTSSAQCAHWAPSRVRRNSLHFVSPVCVRAGETAFRSFLLPFHFEASASKWWGETIPQSWLRHDSSLYTREPWVRRFSKARPLGGELARSA